MRGFALIFLKIYKKSEQNPSFGFKLLHFGFKNKAKMALFF